MLDKSISPLREWMIDDMTARRAKEKAQKNYVRRVRTFTTFLGWSPDTATSKDLSAGPLCDALAAIARRSGRWPEGSLIIAKGQS
jgi:hypothetical protein